MTGGGRPHTFTSDMPPDLRDALPAALTSIDVSFEGETVKLYTNGKRLFTLTERRFARGQVVRVRLGGQDPDDQAVYLAKLRVGTGPSGRGSVRAKGRGPSSRFGERVPRVPSRHRPVPPLG